MWLRFVFTAALTVAQEDAFGKETPIFYRAEKVLFENKEIQWFHDKQIGEFLDKVFKDHWFIKQFPKAKKPKVGVGKFSDKAYSEGDTLFFPPHPETKRPAACNYSILHELTHQLVPGHNHDRAFAMTYATLVSQFVGQESAKALMRSYIENGRPNWVPKNPYGIKAK